MNKTEISIMRSGAGCLSAMAVCQSELKEYPHPRSLEAIAALTKFRGSTIGVEAAEAFMLVREIWH